MGKKLYVGNLPYSVTNAELKKYFEQYGVVITASIVNDRDTGRSRGFGFVEMNDVNVALAESDGSYLNGRQLKVSLAKEKK